LPFALPQVDIPVNFGFGDNNLIGPQGIIIRLPSIKHEQTCADQQEME